MVGWWPGTFLAGPYHRSLMNILPINETLGGHLGSVEDSNVDGNCWEFIVSYNVGFLEYIYY